MKRSTSVSRFPESLAAGLAITACVLVSGCATPSPAPEGPGWARRGASPAVASPQDEGADDSFGGVYVGGSFGYSDARASTGQLQGRLAGRGQNTNVSLDDTSYGWKAFAGYRFDWPLAVELGYTSMEGLDSTITVNSSNPNLNADVRREHPIKGHGVALALLVPVSWKSLTVFGKFGGWLWDADVDINLGGSVLNADDDGVDLLFGAGAQYFLTSNLALRAEFERYYLDRDESDLWTLGGVIRF